MAFFLYILLAAGAAGPLTTGHVVNEHVEYFKSITMSCQDDNGDMASLVYMWVLPSGEKLRGGSHFPHLTLTENSTRLTIHRVDDEDFGMYLCIAKFGHEPSNITVIGTGVNMEGSYYGPEIAERYRKNATIGGIAAACTFVLLVIVWISCTCCGSSDASDKDTKVLEEIENGIPLETPSAGLDTTVYDTADGIHVIQAAKDVEVGIPMSHSTRLQSDESEHYHTIDESKTRSMERNTVLGMGDDDVILGEKQNGNGGESSSGSLTGSGTEAETGYSTNEEIESTASVVSVDQKQRSNVEDIDHTVLDDDVVYAKPIRRKRTRSETDFLDRQSISDADPGPPAVSEESSAPARSDPDFLDRQSISDADPVPPSVSDDSGALTRPKTQRPVDKETVVIVAGEVVLEGTGTTVVVTSVPPSPGTQTESTESIATKTEGLTVPSPSVEDGKGRFPMDVQADTGETMVTGSGAETPACIAADTGEAMVDCEGEGHSGQDGDTPPTAAYPVSSEDSEVAMGDTGVATSNGVVKVDREHKDKNNSVMNELLEKLNTLKKSNSAESELDTLAVGESKETVPKDTWTNEVETNGSERL